MQNNRNIDEIIQSTSLVVFEPGEIEQTCTQEAKFNLSDLLVDQTDFLQTGMLVKALEVSRKVGFKVPVYMSQDLWDQHILQHGSSAEIRSMLTEDNNCLSVLLAAKHCIESQGIENDYALFNTAFFIKTGSGRSHCLFIQMRVNIETTPSNDTIIVIRLA